MLGAFPFAFAYILPAMTLLGLTLGGPWAWSGVLFTFVLTPVIDALVPVDRRNPSPEEENRRRESWAWDALLLGWLPVQVALMVATMVRVVGHGGSPAELAGWVVSLGVTTGAGGITVAHELMHRPGRLHQGLAEVLMTLALYPHFCVEHVLGHHRNVATPLDPASARAGEGLWRFLPRTLWGGLVSAWRLETERVQSKGHRGWSDRRIRQPILLAALILGTAGLAGSAGVAVLVIQAAVAVVLLEIVNYVEHYGLSRQERGEGRFERVQPRHSWNSAHRVTNWYLFNLPRHSDHHYLASRPYPLLRHDDDAPQLPAGYPTMVLLALVPPLWRRVMDPRVRAARAPSREGEPAAKTAAA